MSTKDKVLALLEHNKEKIYSGQLIATQLGVSRTSVWKAIQSLRAEGYLIESGTNNGYRLSSQSDVLNQEQIQSKLDHDVTVIAYASIDSTNSEAKRLLETQLSGNFLVVSDEQTAGRGRHGRFFHSPEKTGLYMSLALQHISSEVDAALLTTAAAVAVCQSIEEMTSLSPKIKWVNDIFLNGRKICGILTEGIMNFETQSVESIILGIGINISVDREQLPEDLKDKVGGITNHSSGTINRNNLTVSIINNFLAIYQNINNRNFLEDYRKRCFVLGKTITFKQKQEQIRAVAEEIDNDGGLVVRLEDGSHKILSYGEISIQMREGEGFYETKYS